MSEQTSLPTPRWSYAEWVRYVFDHSPKPGPLSPDRREDLIESGPPAIALQYLTRLLHDSAELPSRYPIGNVDQGAWYIMSPGQSEYFLLVYDTRLPWSDRQACLESIVDFFRDVFAPAYGNLLADEANNCYACFLWWDVISFHADKIHPDGEKIENTIFDVLEAQLSIRADSCVESALHGLGHWANSERFPGRSKSIIDRFLTNSTLRPDLHQYAERASLGEVQ